MLGLLHLYFLIYIFVERICPKDLHLSRGEFQLYSLLPLLGIHSEHFQKLFQTGDTP